jgi:phosphatidylethanolamine/phosphatidyl-N-methylethanolamine N-methyltransferase
MSSTTAFMIAALSRPGTVGAIVPSSRRLADAMARAAGGSQQLIELGAGTGAITAALCRIHLDVPLTAVELDPRLAQLLRERFPMIEVRAAAAHEVLCEPQRGSGAAVLVSSLPFRSLPPGLRNRSSVAIERFLIERPASRLVQFTHLPWEPFHLRFGASLRWRRLASVWRNMPPASIWELSASNSAPRPHAVGRSPGAA